MGFNVSGLVINKNYQDNFEALQAELGWQLEKQGEVVFESAISSFKDDGVCDVYFAEQGTLLLISIDKCEESWSLPHADTLTFALSETSMVFNLSYCKNGIKKRAIMEIDGEKIRDEGEALAVEASSEDVSEIIWNQMGVVLGKRFWDIEQEEKAVRYVFMKKKKILEPAACCATHENKKDTLCCCQPLSKSKKWWQFWK